MKNNNSKFKNLDFTLLFLVFSFAFYASWSPAQAAVINFSVSDQPLTGEEILIELSLDPEGQNINVLAGEIFIPATLQPVRILDGNSVLKFWVEPPHFNDRKLIFAGMIPGGLPTDSSGDLPLFKFMVKGNRLELTRLTVGKLTALLNDGLGTKTLARMAWRTKSSAGEVIDTTPPEKFTPLLGRDPSLFNNDWFLVFLTQDKQSGVDHYEVSEGGDDNYVRVESPSRLNDQALRKNIYVRAIDRAGNIQGATVILRPWYIVWLDNAILIVISIFSLWFIRLIVRKLFWRSRSAVS